MEYKNKVDMILRQTNYTENEITDKLKTMQPIEIIREYMNICNKTIIKKSNNQQKFIEIRDFMNNVSYKKIQR